MTPARAQQAAGVPQGPDLSQIKTKVNPKDGLTYVWVNPGTFQMGCSPSDKSVTGLGGAAVVCVDSEKPACAGGNDQQRAFWMGDRRK